MDYYQSLSPQPPTELNFEEIFAFYYNLKGAGDADAGKYHEALENFNKALELNPNLSAALFNRATIKADTGDLVGAREDFIRLRELETKYDDAIKVNYIANSLKEKYKNRINIF
ncbi:MAG: tetratricopeptide repeat protein [Ignavibacteriota bacterium]